MANLPEAAAFITTNSGDFRTFGRSAGAVMRARLGGNHKNTLMALLTLASTSRGGFQPDKVVVTYPARYVAELLQVTPASASRRLRALEDRGLITRQVYREAGRAGAEVITTVHMDRLLALGKVTDDWRRRPTPEADSRPVAGGCVVPDRGVVPGTTRKEGCSRTGDLKTPQPPSKGGEEHEEPRPMEAPLPTAEPWKRPKGTRGGQRVKERAERQKRRRRRQRATGYGLTVGAHVAPVTEDRPTPTLDPALAAFDAEIERERVRLQERERARRALEATSPPASTLKPATASESPPSALR